MLRIPITSLVVWQDLTHTPKLLEILIQLLEKELKIQSKKEFGKYPDIIVACVGGGSNAMGIFHPFIKETKTKLVGVEAGGSGVKSGKHAAPLSDGKVGVLHGMKTYLMQDKNGQIFINTFGFSGLRLSRSWSRTCLFERYWKS